MSVWVGGSRTDNTLESSMTSSIYKEDLLEPTLNREGAPAGSIYSPATGFFSSFFGGPIAGAVVTAVNARRLNRLHSDAWLVALGFAVQVALLWWLVRLDGNEWLQSTLGRSGASVARRMTGLAYFGLTYVVHRSYYRNMAFAGITPPSGWRMGILAVGVGGIASVALALLLSL